MAESSYQPPTPPPPRPPPLLPPATKSGSTLHAVHKTLGTAANLANLLPTGTVLSFRALIPSFSNKGNNCQPSNKYLTACLISCCTVACFFSTFVDSFLDSDGKLYYGIASFKGFKTFNYNNNNNTSSYNNDNDEEKQQNLDLSKLRIRWKDSFHAFVSVIVFLVFAFSDSDVQKCYFPDGGGANVNVLLMNLPLGAGILSSFLFMLFPTTRRGIGVAVMPVL